MAARKKAGSVGKTGFRKNPWVVATAIASAVGALALSWHFLVGGKIRPIQADAGDAGLVALGRTVYDANCAACHGANLEGQPNWRNRQADGTLPAPPHDDTGHTWHHPDGQLFDITKYGGQPGMPAGFKSGMPGFEETLTDRQIVATLAYIKSRWPVTIRRRQDAITRQKR